MIDFIGFSLKKNSLQHDSHNFHRPLSVAPVAVTSDVTHMLSTKLVINRQMPLRVSRECHFLFQEAQV